MATYNLASYNLAFPDVAIDAILTTAYHLQQAGYIFRGSASDYSGTPTEREWVIAPAGFTGLGLSSAVPQGSFGICLYNGTAWVGKVINVLTLDSAPTRNSQNGVTSGGVAATLDEIAGGIMETFASLLFDDETAAADLSTKLSYAVKFSVSDVYQTVTHLNILAATTSKAGLLSAADKAKLDALWSSGYQFAGIATPSTTPISTTSNIFYIAPEEGTYTSFGNLNVTQGINIIYKSGNAWSVAQVVGIDNVPTAGSNNLAKSGGIEKTIELRKSYLSHINGENKSSLWFTNFNTEHFHLDMDFVILPNENDSYKDIVTIIHSDDVLIDIGYYTSSGNRNWYIGERLQSSVQYYKEYHLNISYNAGLLCVFINDALIKTFSVPSVLGIIFNRIQAEPTGEMLISHLNFYDNQKFYGVDSIIDNFSATLVDNYILKEIEIIRSEQFDQIGSNNVNWIDGTIGDIQSLVFDENSLGVSSYVITYKDYVVTQPTITYNDDYQISNKPEIIITKSN